MSWLSFFSKEILTMLVAASPFAELRGSIPLAVLFWNFSPIKAYILSVAGNFLPVIPLLFFWHFLSEKLSRKFYWANRFFAWLFERTRNRHRNHFEFWKEIALFVFVAVPLPLTGAWSGTVAAFVFGVPFWRAAIMIGLGIAVAGLAVLFLTGAASNIFSIV
jgi:uncharacterized membrane protein